MPFPVVEVVHTGRKDTTGSTSHVISFPTFNVGDLLLVVFSTENIQSVSVESGTGWIKLGEDADGAAGGVTSAAFYKRATGVGDNLTLSTTVGLTSNWIVYRISGDTGVVFASKQKGSTGNANPPLLTIPQTEDALWIAAVSLADNLPPSAPPADYTNLNSITGVIDGVTTAGSQRALQANQENPGSYTNPSDNWVAWTFGIIGLTEVDAAVSFSSSLSCIAYNATITKVPLLERLRAFAFCHVPSKTVIRPRSASATISSAFSGSGVNPHPCPPASMSALSSVSVEALRLREAQASFAVTSDITGAGGNAKFREVDPLVGLASYFTIPSKAANRSVSIVGRGFILKAFWSKLSPPNLPMVGRLNVVSKARRQGNAFASLSFALTTDILGGVPRPGFAGLLIVGELLCDPGAKRAVKAFPTMRATMNIVVARRRRVKPVLQGTSVSLTFANIADAVYGRADGKFAVTGSAARLRPAFAHLGAHKTKIVVKTKLSPGASLVGTGSITKFWPDKIHAVAASISATSSASLSTAYGVALAVSGQASVQSTAARKRPALATVVGQGAFQSAANKAGVAAGFLHGFAASSGIPIFIEGPKAQFPVNLSIVGFAERRGNATVRTVAKFSTNPMASATRARRANIKAASLAVPSDVGAIRGAIADLSTDVNLFAGWGQRVESVVIEVFS